VSEAIARPRQHRLLRPEPTVHESCTVRDAELGAWTDLGPRTSIVEATFGDYSYTAGDVSIIYADVGKFCSIASHARINPGNHPMWRVTQHHLTYRRVQYRLAEADDAAFFAWRRADRVRVGHDVWIGHGAILLPGVTVGTGAVIGAGAVVTKDVAPYTIAVGVPARPLRERFPPATWQRLMETAWWDWPRELIEARIDDLNDVDRFLEKYGR
jgi:phosphonate metabolism protein (transferase hexapeptide repeat family)